jgi:hypothetical protein
MLKYVITNISTDQNDKCYKINISKACIKGYHDIIEYLINETDKSKINCYCTFCNNCKEDHLKYFK